jgi:solute carrier family 25 2-oxodicarboxylate transporter 21
LAPGCVEVSIMHPLDLVKTRFQLQSATPVPGQPHYTSIAHCMKTMYHTEGVLSFWKGILPPLFVETPKRAWKVKPLALGDYKGSLLLYSLSK